MKHVEKLVFIRAEFLTFLEKRLFSTSIHSDYHTS